VASAGPWSLPARPDLGNSGLLERAGGPANSSLVDLVPDVENIEVYARLAAEAFCLDDTRQQIADAAAESRARGLLPPSDEERAARRIAAASILLASPDARLRRLGAVAILGESA
jgi:hypothetical protein